MLAMATLRTREMTKHNTPQPRVIVALLLGQFVWKEIDLVGCRVLQTDSKCCHVVLCAILLFAIVRSHPLDNCKMLFEINQVPSSELNLQWLNVVLV